MARVPQPFHHWILDQSSLTQRLVQLSAGRFRVRVLSEGVQSMRAEEALSLGVRPRSRALIREVELLCDGMSCVYARSVIPLSSLKGKQRRLAHLGDKPLGAFLFADKSLRRERVEVLPLDSQREAWGRRSLFRIGGYPLFVSEYFLPALIEYESQRSGG